MFIFMGGYIFRIRQGLSLSLFSSQIMELEGRKHKYLWIKIVLINIISDVSLTEKNIH